jgi:hypothetical protein
MLLIQLWSEPTVNWRNINAAPRSPEYQTNNTMNVSNNDMVNDRTILRDISLQSMKRSETGGVGASVPDGDYPYQEVMIGGVSTSECSFNVYNLTDVEMNRGIVYS